MSSERGRVGEVRSEGVGARGRAVVAGALGIVGRDVAEHLVALGWDVVGIARSAPTEPVAFRLLRLDLTDAVACRAALARERGVSHVFYAARASAADGAGETAVNLGMLVNLLEPLLAGGDALRHVCLVHGSKWYGSHLGPYKTPAREDDPRQLPPNYYYDQLDYVAARQAGQPWTWSSLRPAVVCGYSLRYPHNIVAVLAVYATICRELGLPLRFPGTPACFDSVSQATDVGLLSRAMAWAATDPRAANQSFNLVNGDVFRWRHVWARLAAHFGLEDGGVQTVPLERVMADKEPLWRSLVERHGLRPLALRDIVDWRYGEATLRQGWDRISSPIKARLAGFDGCVDTEPMFIELIERYRAQRVIP